METAGPNRGTGNEHSIDADGRSGLDHADQATHGHFLQFAGGDGLLYQALIDHVKEIRQREVLTAKGGEHRGQRRASVQQCECGCQARFAFPGDERQR